jgi:glycosyltransferase involved in cell wall biosynthesis
MVNKQEKLNNKDKISGDIPVLPGKKEKPLVSVITPFMNEEEYLSIAIESVISQTYTNWEYILVDDGSKDKSSEIAKGYAERYPGKIFYFDHEDHQNKGVCATRNLGISKANGEFIALLDGDDFWLPEKLEKQVELAQEHPQAQMICEASHYMDKGRNPKIDNTDVPVGTASEKLYQPPALINILYPLGKGDAPCMNALLIKTQFVRSIGGFEESFAGKYFLYEDQAFLFKIYYNGPVYVSSLCNNIYRQRSESNMHRMLAKGSYIDGRKFFLQWLKNYLNKQEKQYPEINARFRKASLLAHHPRIYKYSYGLLGKIKNRLPGNK